MTNEYLRKIFYAYAQHKDGPEVDEVESYIDDALNVMEIIKRIVKDGGNYYNPNFGVGKLYIDGCTDYLSPDEEGLVKKFFETYCNRTGDKE